MNTLQRSSQRCILLNSRGHRAQELPSGNKMNAVFLVVSFMSAMRQSLRAFRRPEKSCRRGGGMWRAPRLDKEHGVAKKRQEVPESSTLVPVHSAVNCAHTSSYHTPVQSGDPSTPFSAPPPSVTPDYRHEYCPPPSQTPDSRYEYYPPPSVTPDCRYEYYPPPSVTPDYKHEYHPPSHSIAWDSRNESKDNAHQTERPVGPPQGPPNIMSSTRFMPRTTQLQERQRKREERTRLDLLLPESQEIVIGPKLPEIPKLDMTDDSLNISADLIRAKLKEGSASCTLTRTEPPTEDPPAAPLAKQRRRI
ncbi:unnamed protein product [Staurois parvus]|uniref:Uncharacterized protein n=1 Tax=Staurois parvus TaxID=386267 RepID=A0ABN9E789_9NEOB|nr:unnamed protein product [Staurois parvus]